MVCVKGWWIDSNSGLCEDHVCADLYNCVMWLCGFKCCVCSLRLLLVALLIIMLSGWFLMSTCALFLFSLVNEWICIIWASKIIELKWMSSALYPVVLFSFFISVASLFKWLFFFCAPLFETLSKQQHWLFSVVRGSFLSYSLAYEDNAIAAIASVLWRDSLHEK